MIPGDDVEEMAAVIGDMQEAGGELRWADEELLEEARLVLKEGRVERIRQRLVEQVLRTPLGQDARESVTSEQEAAADVLRFLVFSRLGWRLEHVTEDWRLSTGMPDVRFQRASAA